MNLERHVLVVGRSGVGKTTFSFQLAEFLSTSCINSGDAMRSYMRRRQVGLQAIVDTGAVFLREFGLHAVGAAIIEEADAAGATIIDGPRLFSTWTHYSSRCRAMDVVFMEAREDLRLARFRQRSIAEGEATSENVAELLARKDVWDGDLAQFIEVSRWRFDNSGTVEELRSFADRVAVDLKN
jgi:dephospho-CoA kinase